MASKIRRGLKMKKTLIIIVSAFMIMAASFSVSGENNLKDISQYDVPERIILNLTENPAHEMAVTWSTCMGVEDSQIEYMIATPWSNQSFNFKDGPDPYKNTRFQKAVSETVHTGKDTSALHHSVILKDLKPGILYQYRVGNGKTWSEWAHFRTSAIEAKPFKFIFLGDPQNDIKSFCSRAFRSAYAAAPDARFILIGGDLVTHPWEDNLWDELFYAAGWITRQVPFVLVAGNHGYYYSKEDKVENKKQHRFWRPHFTQPENGPGGLAETAFFIDFQGVRFIVLNGNEKLTEQVKWLEELLAKNKNRWTIIAIHHPFYSTGRDRDNPILRNLFMPVIDKYAVDLVLQGHDHTYGRTYKLRDGKIVPDSKKGTVFVVSVSGPKFYPINEKHKLLMKKIDTAIQLYQVITVDKNVLKFEAHTITGELYDSFELKKSPACN
jgi:hypothetical protein